MFEWSRAERFTTGRLPHKTPCRSLAGTGRCCESFVCGRKSVIRFSSSRLGLIGWCVHTHTQQQYIYIYTTPARYACGQPASQPASLATFIYDIMGSIRKRKKKKNTEVSNYFPPDTLPSNFICSTLKWLLAVTFLFSFVFFFDFIRRLKRPVPLLSTIFLSFPT